MKLLKRNYYIFTLLSICDPETATSKWIRYRNAVFTFFHLFVEFVGVASSIAFIGNYITVDLVNSLGAGFQGCTLYRFSPFLSLRQFKRN